MNSFQIRIHPFAELDIKHAKEWYNGKSDNLGDEFFIEVEKTISQLLYNPKQFPTVTKNIRKAVVKRFPFCIFYIVGANTIDVYAVFHNSRNPQVWRNRIT